MLHEFCFGKPFREEETRCCNGADTVKQRRRPSRPVPGGLANARCVCVPMTPITRSRRRTLQRRHLAAHPAAPTRRRQSPPRCGRGSEVHACICVTVITPVRFIPSHTSETPAKLACSDSVIGGAQAPRPSRRRFRRSTSSGTALVTMSSARTSCLPAHRRWWSRLGTRRQRHQCLLLISPGVDCKSIGGGNARGAALTRARSHAGGRIYSPLCCSSLATRAVQPV